MRTFSKVLRSAIFAVSLISFWSCVKEVNQAQQETELHDVVFHAGWDQETKTVLQEDGNVWWSPGDEISVFVGSGSDGGYKLTSTNAEPAPNVDFVGQISGIPNGAKYVAVYPYSVENSFDGNVLNVKIPSVQIAKENTFDKDLFVSIAVSEDENLYFRNICSGIKFSVTQPGIRKIVISARDSTPIAGSCSLEYGEEMDNVCGTLSTITVTAPNETGFEPGKYYYAVLLPFNSDSGIDVSYYKDGEVATLGLSQPVEFKRGVFKRLYDGDDGLQFRKHFNSYAYFSRLLPDGVDKTKIQHAYFIASTDKSTDVVLSNYGASIYFELKGTSAYYYTSAEAFDISDTDTFYGWNSLEELDLSRVNAKDRTSFAWMFGGCVSLQSLDLSGLETSHVNDMSYMFSCCSNLKELDLSMFDTSNVVDMREMFGSSLSYGPSYFGEYQGCSSLERLDLSSFNTDNVVWMEGMFNSCSNLREINLSGWNTSQVENMAFMFKGCQSLEELDLSSFNTRNVTSMVNMFQSCKSLKSIDLSNFETPCLSDINYMFYGCDSIEEIYMGNFTSESITGSIYSLFGRCGHLKKIDLGLLDLTNVPSLYYSFSLTANCGKSCAIRCTQSTKEAILNKSSQIVESYFCWVLPGEDMPDLADIIEPDLYSSTDYSMDGKSILLNRANVGKGVDIVLIGDAYSDRLIEDGTYERDMREAMENIFSFEPFISFRDMFNVYMVYAVSDNEVASGHTALCVYQDGFDDSIVNGYASSAVGNRFLSDVATIVISRDETCLEGTGHSAYVKSIFTCDEDEVPVDFGQSSWSIAVVPKYKDSDSFSYGLIHEFGHLFAKLADEYVEYDSPIWESEMINFTLLADKLGIYRNVDITSDPTLVKWRRFLTDPRYEGTGIGVYEGAQFSSGVWRPSPNSIMNSSLATGYNAPSREAIYNRIHKLAFGYDWVYDYEQFVEWDSKNIVTEKDFYSTVTTKANSASTKVVNKSYFEITDLVLPDGMKGYMVIME